MADPILMLDKDVFVNQITPPRPNVPAPHELTPFEIHANVLLCALARHDEATRLHSNSVAAWSRRIAVTLGLAPNVVTFIERCALLHDIGKVLTPRSILTKPGPLSPDEWIRMKAHAAEGAAMLEEAPALAGYADVVRAHHEHFDGRGYPSGLGGDAIPFGARIIAVADAFDAMISKRCYRAALAPSAAIAELQRCRGSQFEATIVDGFVSTILRARRSHLTPQQESNFGARDGTVTSRIKTA